MTNITSVYISPFGKTNILFKVTLRVWGDNRCSLLEKLGIILFVVNINNYRIAKGLVKYGNYHNQNDLESDEICLQKQKFDCNKDGNTKNQILNCF